jgi:hypothetical protein
MIVAKEPCCYYCAAIGESNIKEVFHVLFSSTIKLAYSEKDHQFLIIICIESKVEMCILYYSFVPFGATAQGELWPPEQSVSILLCSCDTVLQTD